MRVAAPRKGSKRPKRSRPRRATVRVAVGTDIVRLHPVCDPVALGRALTGPHELLALLLGPASRAWTGPPVAPQRQTAVSKTLAAPLAVARSSSGKRFSPRRWSMRLIASVSRGENPVRRRDVKNLYMRSSG